MTGVAAEIREFLVPRLAVADVADDADLFASGVVHSRIVMELILFIERRYGFPVEVSEMDFTHFRSIAATAAYVEAKRREGDR